MAEKLGIFVSSDKNLRHVIEITKAAEAAGKEVYLFFTHKGVLLTQVPEFKELTGLGKKSLCNVSYESKGLKGKPAPGIAEKDFATQARHGEMIEEVNRYIVM
ncbi:MAG TPA: peroxiredoxin [Thermodesulfobacteriota bacterium]|nr:peroxiredoxin [Thermodesulfobacteriota bacterium]